MRCEISVLNGQFDFTAKTISTSLFGRKTHLKMVIETALPWVLGRTPCGTDNETTARGPGYKCKFPAARSSFAGGFRTSKRGHQRWPARHEGVPTLPPDSGSPPFQREIEQSFLELRDPVYRYLRTLGCRHPLAEEITQESFLRLYIELCNGLKVGNVRAWIFRVARNLWLDNRKAAHPDGEDLDQMQSNAVPDPEQQVLLRERLRLVESELRRLPKLQRECLHLKAQELRYHEIATALNIPMTAAVHHVRRAVRKLEKRLPRIL
jgi:RNA polymerase sigma-70 factor (ECF subfamily)